MHTQCLPPASQPVVGSIFSSARMPQDNNSMRILSLVEAVSSARPDARYRTSGHSCSIMAWLGPILRCPHLTLTAPRSVAPRIETAAWAHLVAVHSETLDQSLPTPGIITITLTPINFPPPRPCYRGPCYSACLAFASLPFRCLFRREQEAFVCADLDPAIP